MFIGWVLFSPIYFLMAYLNNFPIFSLHTFYGYGVFCAQFIIYQHFIDMIEKTAKQAYNQSLGQNTPPAIINIGSILLFSIIAIVISKWYLLDFKIFF